ncbi:MBL fold metallo-hydrolase [Thermotalea metallivorans]|uniref:beta-lactamase n=1 Tax=Thermotalea metallivorans TaxID=520762 RepID=A0A140L7C1_9FIRM|nr:MBL fold metallo-hydrolase [Thermotalea metallivorans]KXG76446.1 hypothetical protein AN619_09770 [Thermotalea metallivorans]
MELKKISDRVYYISNVVNIGCIVSGKEAVVIDTGLEDAVGKKIVNILGKEGLTVRVIINTHSHADHFGGNAYIQEKTGAVVYAPAMEESIIQYPYFEPFYLFSGANPVKELQNKFLMGKPSKVDYVIPKGETTLDILGIKLGIIPLPGHSMNQIGIEIDNILFCGDAFISEEVLKKHKIPFHMDINRQRETLQWFMDTAYGWYIPSHGEPVERIDEVVQMHMDVLDDIEQCILQQLSWKKTTEQLVKAVCDTYGVQVSSLGQYYLLHTTIVAHIGALADMQKIRAQVENNQVYWTMV